MRGAALFAAGYSLPLPFGPACCGLRAPFFGGAPALDLEVGNVPSPVTCRSRTLRITDPGYQPGDRRSRSGSQWGQRCPDFVSGAPHRRGLPGDHASARLASHCTGDMEGVKPSPVIGRVRGQADLPSLTSALDQPPGWVRPPKLQRPRRSPPARASRFPIC